MQSAELKMFLFLGGKTRKIWPHLIYVMLQNDQKVDLNIENMDPGLAKRKQKQDI